MRKKIMVISSIIFGTLITFFLIGVIITNQKQGNTVSELSAPELVATYAKAKGKYFLIPTENTDFNTVVGPMFFRYTASSGELLTSGYVASGQVGLVNKIAGQRIWNRLVTYATLQPTTLGGGELELYTGELDPLSDKPAVYLTRKYTAPFPNGKDFIEDMDWLAQMSTYWRDERWSEVFSGRTDEELRKEAAEAEEWAQSKK